MTMPALTSPRSEALAVALLIALGLVAPVVLCFALEGCEESAPAVGGM